jgi:hypothetical protein
MLQERNSGQYGVFLSRQIFSRNLLRQGFAGSAIIVASMIASMTVARAGPNLLRARTKLSK